MTRQNEARTQISPWLAHLAWNAAALAALAVMLLVLLGSLEWLDQVSTTPPTPRSARAAEKPAPLPIVVVGGASAVKGGGEGCAAPRSRSG